MLEGKLKTLINQNDTNVLVLFHKSQMLNEYSSSYTPQIVRGFIEINLNWIPSVVSSIEELNMHVPRLVLAVTKDRTEADVVMVDNVTPNKIYNTSWLKSGSHYAAVIAFAQKFKGISELKQASSMLAILHGIGFCHQMTKLYSILAKI